MGAIDSFPSPGSLSDLVSNPPTVKVKRTTGQLLTTAVAAAVNFDGEDWDSTGAMHSTVSNTSRLLPGAAGKYRVWAYVSYDFNTTGRRISALWKNGFSVGEQLAEVDTGPPLGESDCSLYAEVQLATTDYVEVVAYQASGGNLNTWAKAGMTWFGP
jgi:hypothetical protein